MNIFEFDNYREFLRSYIHHLPQHGRGELSKIADVLRISRTMLSQIMSGVRELSLDQAHELSLYLQLTELESDYFDLLVQVERTTTQKYKSHLKKKVSKFKENALNLSKRVPHEKELTDVEKSLFYSTWLYSAIHLATTLKDEGLTAEEISSRFGLDRVKTIGILDFLVRAQLCVEEKGKYKIGVRSTFVPFSSPHVLKHHSNWRIKALQKSDQLSKEEMMFTSQISLAKKDFSLVREKLAQFIKDVEKIVSSSDPDDLANLNIDWFWI